MNLNGASKELCLQVIGEALMSIADSLKVLAAKDGVVNVTCTPQIKVEQSMPQKYEFDVPEVKQKVDKKAFKIQHSSSQTADTSTVTDVKPLTKGGNNDKVS